MRTHNGNVGAVIADVGGVTIASLAKYGIPYDELSFGKPYAHIYVDDLAVNANIDTRREIGWMAADIDTDGDASPQNLLAELKHAKKAGIVPSRDFNHVQFIGERVIKSSRSSKLLAEMYFYSRLPASLSTLFPHLYSTSYFPETATFSFTMQKLRGISYSHLLVARSLTKRRLDLMLNALHRVHTCTEPPVEQSPNVISAEIQSRVAQQSAHSGSASESTANGNVNPEGQVDIYANYARKLASRYHDYQQVYDLLDPQKTQQMYATILASLESYEATNRAGASRLYSWGSGAQQYRPR